MPCATKDSKHRPGGAVLEQWVSYIGAVGYGINLGIVPSAYRAGCTQQASGG